MARTGSSKSDGRTGSKIRVTTIDDYIDLQAPPLQPLLLRVRRAIAKAVPAAEETISYSIPAYKLYGRILLYFAGWKEHYSIYPASDAMVAAFDGELDAYRVSKGTLRFPLSEPVPAKLIERIANFRAEELAGPAPRKPAAKKHKTRTPARKMR